MVDVEGARALSRGLSSLAAAAEAAFERRDRAAGAAARGWTGPLGRELARRTASEAAHGREVVAALRSEAAGWLRVADAAADVADRTTDGADAAAAGGPEAAGGGVGAGGGPAGGGRSWGRW